MNVVVSEVVPDTKGRGYAMRPGLHLSCLSKVFDVTLLIISSTGGRDICEQKLPFRATSARSMKLFFHEAERSLIGQ